MSQYIKRTGSSLSGDSGAITNGKYYEVIAWDSLSPGPLSNMDGNNGAGGAYALIVDDNGNPFVAQHIFQIYVGDWQFVSATHLP